MSASATKMRNHFVLKPTDDFIMEIGKTFNLRDAVIALDANDVKTVMRDAENSIILHGKATGNNRCADAIEDAVLHTCSVAKDYDLFTANKLLLQFLYPKDSPMLMSESEAIHTFIEMFPSELEYKWGLAENDDTDSVRVIIIASNLKRRYDRCRNKPVIG